jgi:Flp pilus assembly protein TadD
MRLSKLLAALAVALLMPFPAMQANAQTDAQLAEAQRLFKAGQLPQALAKADAHIGTKPRDPQGRFMKGLILAEMKKTPEAIAVFKRLTEDFPELPEPYNNLAVLYAQEKQYERARQALESAIKTHPSYAVAHENLGDVYSKLASQAYNKALQIDATNPSAQSKLALIRDLISVTARQSPRPAEAARPPEPVKPLAALTPPPAVASPPQTAVRPPVAAAAPPAVAPASAAALLAPVATAAATAPTAAAQVPTATAAAPSPARPSAAPTPAPAAVAATTSPDDVAKVVRTWAADWSKKNVRGYLAAYAPEFVPPNGLSRAAWEAERSARLTKPGTIEVGVEKLEVTLQGTDRATAKFRQNYKSANLKSSAGKSLLLVRSNGHWLIREERVN